MAEDHAKKVLGLSSPRTLRESADLSLDIVIEDFFRDLLATGRTKKYATKLRTRINNMARGCGWKVLQDIEPDSFIRWRQRQDMSGKTLNHYLAAIKALLNWLLSIGKLEKNPLQYVKSVDVRATENEEKRAFTEEELRLICSVEKPRSLIYLLFALTGMRQNEVREMTWEDVRIDEEFPHILLKPCDVKNRKLIPIPLLPELTEELRDFRPTSVDPNQKVFPKLVPKMERFHRDLESVGVAVVDSMGRRAGFHTFRRTFDTMLNLQGASPVGTMNLMRQHSVSLATKKYMDATQINARRELEKLRGIQASLIASQKSAHRGENEENLTSFDEANKTSISSNSGSKPQEKGGFSNKEDEKSWWRRGELNPRP